MIARFVCRYTGPCNTLLQLKNNGRPLQAECLAQSAHQIGLVGGNKFSRIIHKEQDRYRFNSHLGGIKYFQAFALDVRRCDPLVGLYQRAV